MSWNPIDPADLYDDGSHQPHWARAMCRNGRMHIIRPGGEYALCLRGMVPSSPSKFDLPEELERVQKCPRCEEKWARYRICSGLDKENPDQSKYHKRSRPLTDYL